MKTLCGAYVNLLKTSIGSGVLSFPFLFKIYGIIPSILLTIVTGFFAATGLVLLSICAHEVGRSADLSRLGDLTLRQARFLVDIAVFLKCFGVSTSYIIIARQLLPQLIKTVFPGASTIAQPPVSLFFFMLFVTPFSFLRKLDVLKYTSFTGLLCIVCVIFASFVRLFIGIPSIAAFRWFTPFSILWFANLGKFLFSFTCHQNIFAANAEMENNSLPRMRRLVYYVSSSAFVLYMSFGISNYLIYGNSVSDNVLRNYPQDHLATFVRGLYIIVMGVSYPLQITPARVYFMNIINIKPKSYGYNVVYVVSTSILLLTTYALAVSGVELGLVYALVGATASTSMCLILPLLFYLNMSIERSRTLTIIGYCAFLFGIMVSVSTIYSIMLGIH